MKETKEYLNYSLSIPWRKEYLHIYNDFTSQEQSCKLLWKSDNNKNFTRPKTHI